MMQNIYRETRILDKRAVDKFLLTEEILLENASIGLKRILDSVTHPKSVVYIVCGGGNNGADGLALARKLEGDYVVRVYMASEPKTSLCHQEFIRCKNLGIDFVHKLYACDVVVDCLYGSGFRGQLDLADQELIKTLNKMSRIRIACDIPSGLMQQEESVIFKAHHTAVMGGLKLDLFQEWAKDYVGKIHIVDLGISRKKYEISSKIKLLEKNDLHLPLRFKNDTHKGEYGHLAILCKKTQASQNGASVLSALSALAFGSGLVSLVGEAENPPYSIMTSKAIPQNTTALALGMGMGKVEKTDLDLIQTLPCVLDADVFGCTSLKDYLPLMKNIVLTPHIKEFANLLKLCNLADLSPKEVKTHRFVWVEEFCLKYPQVVLVLKGSYTLIAQNQSLFICPFGSNNLAKGGSGDVLSGMIASLLAQGYDPLQASISGVLAHSLASENIKTTYGLNPMDLIEAIKYL